MAFSHLEPVLTKGIKTEPLSFSIVEAKCKTSYACNEIIFFKYELTNFAVSNVH